MKQLLKGLRNIIIGFLLIIYFSFIIIISTILLNKNDFGLTQINDKILIMIDKNSSNKNYKEGTLVILETKEIEELKVGQEVFIYFENNNSNSIIITNIDSINNNEIIIENDINIEENLIIGTKYLAYKNFDLVYNILNSKIIFVSVMLLPCLVILIYGIYLLISALKSQKSKKVIIENNEENYEKTIKNEKQFDNIQEQVNELINTSVNIPISEIVEDKNEKIDELMQEISELRKEYDTQELFVLDKATLEHLEKNKVVKEKKEIKQNINNSSSKKQNNNKKNNKKSKSNTKKRTNK